MDSTINCSENPSSKLGHKQTEAKKCQCFQNFYSKAKKSHTKNYKKIIMIPLTIGLVLCTLNIYLKSMNSKSCLLILPSVLRYAFRPPENCNFCENVDQVVRLKDVSSDEFESIYAYSGRPAIIEDATKNWTALTKFNYWYFRDVYFNAKRKSKILDCQFLPYKSGFRDLFEALSMPDERVVYTNTSKPWYFGWSNCNPETAEEFRKHYGRPYFLPKNSENNAVDWFFIGTSGLGAHMHIDNVRLPSWQAQLSGSKRWVLAPPPECYFKCKQFDTVVQKGDIIVLDTNKWYHQTFVQPGEVSLTIGAEYD